QLLHPIRRGDPTSPRGSSARSAGVIQPFRAAKTPRKTRKRAGYGAWAAAWGDSAPLHCARNAAATSRRAGPSGELLRQTTASVREGGGSVKGRIAKAPRRFSAATASLGKSVMPAPPATICASVGRLVARKLSSRSPAAEQSESACSRK